MASGGGHKKSSKHHDHQEEDDKQMKKIIKSLDDNLKRIRNLKLLDGVLAWEVLHLKDVITTKHALKHQREYATSPPVKLRIASWNLKKATLTGKHPDKIGMIFETIAHIDPDIIALQEIASSPSDFLKNIRDQLFEPWGIATEKVGKNEYSAFLWKNGLELQMKKTSPVTSDFSRSRKVQAMEVQIGPFEFTLLNFHFAPRSDDDRIEINDYEVLQLVRMSSRLEKEKFPSKNLILIGDFNTYPLDDYLNKRLRFENILGPQEYTNVSRNKCYDNIIVHQKLKLCCTSSSVQDIIVDPVTATAEQLKHKFVQDIIVDPVTATAEQLKHKFDHLPICAEFEIPRQLNLMPAYGYINIID